MSLDRGSVAHIILYVRDACRLTPSGPDVPPPLIGEVQVLELNLSPAKHSEVSQAWLEWWRRYIHVQGQIELGHNFGASRSADRIHAIGNAISSVFDPFEGFESLEDSPLLKDAAVKTWRQGAEWFELYGTRRNRHGLTLPLTVAESVIRDKRVSPERVRAAVLIFGVIGKWSNLLEPGLLLCTEETYADESLFATELKRTFESGIELPLD